MRRDLLPVLYDWVAGIAGNVSSPGTSPQTPLRYTTGALGGTRDFATRNRWAAPQSFV